MSSSSVYSVTVNATTTTTIANANVDSYVVSFETDYTLDTANIVAIQAFVVENKEGSQKAVVKMPADSNTCNLLQTYTDLSTTTPKNISSDVFVYLVTLIANGTTYTHVLNHTMKTVTKLN